MSDKQLQKYCLKDIAKKVERDAIINAREASVYYGIGYSKMRAMLSEGTFPLIGNGFHPSDYQEWRRQKAGLTPKPESKPRGRVNPKSPTAGIYG